MKAVTADFASGTRASQVLEAVCEMAKAEGAGRDALPDRVEALRCAAADCRRAAQERLRKMPRREGVVIVLAYRAEDAGGADSARLDRLREEAGEAYLRLKEAGEEWAFEGSRKRFAECAACGSRISLEHLGRRPAGSPERNLCPVCMADLRPEPLAEKVKKAQAAWDEASGRMGAERKRIEDGRVRWLAYYPF